MRVHVHVHVHVRVHVYVHRVCTARAPPHPMGTLIKGISHRLYPMHWPCPHPYFYPNPYSYPYPYPNTNHDANQARPLSRALAVPRRRRHARDMATHGGSRDGGHCALPPLDPTPDPSTLLLTLALNPTPDPNPNRALTLTTNHKP